MITIKHLVLPAHITQAQDFYASLGYQIQIQSSDYVVAAFDNDQIIGVVRLSFDEGTITLRGMMIAPAYQRQGIGTMLIKSLEPTIGTKTCWCIPHGWLEGFYGQIGFKKIDEDKAPLFLQERIKEARKKWPHVILMVRG